MGATLRFRCEDCGQEHDDQPLACPACGHYFSVKAHVTTPRSARATADHGVAVPAELITPKHVDKLTTGVPRLDSVLHGGYVLGCMHALSGAPGSGKSRLARVSAAAAARKLGRRALLVSAEEPNEQVRANLDEMGLPASLFDLVYSGDLAVFEPVLVDKRPSLFVFDSLQYLDDSRLDGGNKTRRLDAFKRLRSVLLQRRTTAITIVHVNAENDIADDRNFERLVDAHFFIGQPMGKSSPARTLEIRKSRFHGPDTAYLTMTNRGMQ